MTELRPDPDDPHPLVSPLVPFPDRPITSRHAIVQYAGLLRWAWMDEAQILAQLLRKYGDGSITESAPGWPWSLQDFQKIAKDMGAKPLPPLVSQLPIPRITRMRKEARVLPPPRAARPSVPAEGLRLRVACERCGRADSILALEPVDGGYVHIGKCP